MHTRPKHLAPAIAILPATAWAHGSGLALLVPGVPTWLLAFLATLYVCRARLRRSVALRGTGTTIFAVLACFVLGLAGWALLSAFLFDRFHFSLGAEGLYAFFSPWLIPAVALLVNRLAPLAQPHPAHE